MTTTLARDFLSAIRNATVQLEVGAAMLRSHSESKIEVFDLPNDKPTSEAIVADKFIEAAKALDDVRYFFYEIVNDLPEGTIARANKEFFCF